MDQTTLAPGALNPVLQASEQRPLVEIVETSATAGEWATPAVKKVSIGLARSNFSAKWRGARGLRSEDISAGTVAICEFDRSQQFEMRNAAEFGIAMLSNEVLEQVGQETRYLRPELQKHEVLKDSTLRRLMEILLSEKQASFRSGLFFLDSVSTTLASYLLRHYSAASAVFENSTGGLAPSVLRRSIEFIQTHLEGNLRLSDLAHEAKISTSHLVRSFRQSTGKTPYQYLLHQRIERAQSLMRDHRTPLTEVALASGFADQHHLARVFRRITGMTPSSYRRSL
ncbi:MAG TPA: AraC family transcriptional regulator [Edaphobacter sp.]|nr:AraC family transcriptional regulator [Edaphobacter sp.]